MSSLRRTKNAFELDLDQAVSSLLGAPALPDSDPLRFLEGPTGPVLAVKENSGAGFVRGLLSAYRTHTCPLLAAPRDLGSLPAEFKAREVSSPSSDGQQLSGLIHVEAEQNVAALLTSGSTGAPQLFYKRARPLFSEALTLVSLLEMCGSSVVLKTTASHHVYGLLFGVLAPFASGARIVVDPRADPARFHPSHVERLTREFSVTHLITVPAHLAALTDSSVDLSGLHSVSCSAARLSPKDARAFEDKFKVPVLDVLGSTETGGIALRRPAKTTKFTPMPGVSLRKKGDEVLLSSPHLETQGVEQPLDDEIELFDDGTFEHLGRRDSIVKVGGKRVSLLLIESAARKLPGVTDARALSRPMEGLRGVELLLIVVCRELSADEIRAALKRSLDPVFVPRRIRCVEALPESDRGKLVLADALALFDARSSEPERKPKQQSTRIPVSVDARRFLGHFDQDPVLPAVAQLIDLLLPEIRKRDPALELAEISRVKWKHPIRPEDEVSLVIEEQGNALGNRSSLEEQGRVFHFTLFATEVAACTGVARFHPIK